jgi:hypothetical protein
LSGGVQRAREKRGDAKPTLGFALPVGLKKGKERCGAEPALSERSESNGRLLEGLSEESPGSLARLS